jgi:tetratricopeptide (TPR) repeat protein
MLVLLVLLSYFLTVLVHEVGHVIAALIVGWKPTSLKVGGGRGWTLFRIGGIQVELGPVLLGGMVRALAPSASHFRLKDIILSIGGTVANICFALLIGGVLFGADRYGELPYWVQQMMIFLLVFNLLFIAHILIPRYNHIEGHMVPNDARQILNMLRMTDAEVKSEARKHIRNLFNFYLSRNRLAEIKALVVESPEAFGSELDARSIWIHALLRAGKREDAVKEIELLSKEGIPSMPRAEVLDGLACISFYYGHPELLDDSMRYIDEAIAEAPDLITLKGTKGALLVETGRTEEGISMLEEVLNTTSALVDRVTSAYYLALACHKKGDSQQAIKHLEFAIALAPRSIVRQRVEKEIRAHRSL